MTREKERKFEHAARQIHVVLEDDLGAQHLVQFHAGRDACPMCARPYPRNAAGQVDLKKLLEELSAEIDRDVDQVIAEFERHGADMSAAKAKRLSAVSR
jgi:DNA repair exonuclease SbcCD ATPase subunit